MKKYSLFIGRFQPLHNGHVELIRSVLDEGKNVCVALRKTGINKDNPYTLNQRVAMFEKEFKIEMDLNVLIIIPIPDVQEVCYGRKVGWGIREIRLDEKTESISATKIREGKK